MGEEDDGAPDPDDPFRQLLEPGFQTGAAAREPSAEERARTAERARRSADLARRLQEEQAHHQELDRRDRAVERRQERNGRMARVAGPALVLVVVVGGAVVWWRQERSPSAAAFDGPPPGVDASASPLGSPPPLPAEDGPYEFVATQPGGDEPVAWDPCRPIRYVVNPAGAPPGGDALAEEAVARTASATGLRFEYAGTTDEAWTDEREAYLPDRYGERWAPVLIAWSDESSSPDLAGSVAGVGGPSSVRTADGRSVHVSGSVVLDAPDLERILAAPGGPDAVRAVIQHELGHVVGLDHVADRAQLMYTENTDEQTSDWGAGDLRGLHALGSGDCFPDL
jgi:hypothetical protein